MPHGSPSCRFEGTLPQWTTPPDAHVNILPQLSSDTPFCGEVGAAFGHPTGRGAATFAMLPSGPSAFLQQAPLPAQLPSLSSAPACSGPHHAPVL